MRQPHHLISPSEALRRVFLPHLTDASRIHPTRPRCLLPHPRPCPLRPPQARHASTDTDTIKWRHWQAFAPAPTSPPQHRFDPKDDPARRPQDEKTAGAPSPPRPRFGPKDAPAKHPQDEGIPAFKVHLVQPTDNRLSEPRLLTDVLALRARDDRGRYTEFVQQVSAPSAERPFPVCKLVDKKAAREAEGARRKAERAARRGGKVPTKRFEVNWSVDDNDLEHRMARLKEFLGKGWKVEVMFGSKRKRGWQEKKELSAEEASGVVEKIRKAVGEVKGAWEGQMQGEVGKDAILSFEGTAKK